MERLQSVNLPTLVESLVYGTVLDCHLGLMSSDKVIISKWLIPIAFPSTNLLQTYLGEKMVTS